MRGHRPHLGMNAKPRVTPLAAGCTSLQAVWTAALPSFAPLVSPDPLLFLRLGSTMTWVRLFCRVPRGPLTVIVLANWHGHFLARWHSLLAENGLQHSHTSYSKKRKRLFTGIYLFPYPSLYLPTHQHTYLLTCFCVIFLTYFGFGRKQKRSLA